MICSIRVARGGLLIERRCQHLPSRNMNATNGLSIKILHAPSSRYILKFDASNLQ